MKPRSFFVMAIAILACVFALPRAFAVDHGGRCAPVMYYDPATGESRPFFVIGWYAWLKPATLKWIPDMAAGGANVVHLVDISAKQFDLAGRALDVARRCGMKVTLSFHRRLLDNVRPDVPASYAAVRRFVGAYRTHPALLGWCLGDENPLYDFLSAEDVVNSATVIHRLDPHHQLWQVFAYPENRRHGVKRRAVDYMKGTDVISSDTYVHYDGQGTNNPRFAATAEFENVEKTLRMEHVFASIAAKAGKSYVNVTQAFGPDGPDLPMFRFPTAREYRWNVFSAIVSAGAQGTLNWVYRPESPKENPTQWWYRDLKEFYDFRDKIVKPVFDELHLIAHAMEARRKVGKVRVDWPGKPAKLPAAPGAFAAVSHLLLYDDRQSKWFLIITNNTGGLRKVNVSLSGLPGKPPLVLTALRSGRTFRPTRTNAGVYTFQDALNGHDVVLYVLKPCEVKQ